MAGPQAREPLWPEPNRRRAGLVSCRRHVRRRDRLRKWKNDRGICHFGRSVTVGLIQAGLRDRLRQHCKWRRHVTRRELARPRPRPPLVLERRSLFLNRLLRFQDARPVELDTGVRLLDQPDGVFVEGRTSDPYSRWRAEPVKDPRMRSPPATLIMNDVGVLVSELVAAEPEVGQDLLPLL